MARPAVAKRAWRRVVFAYECDAFGNCPVCETDYSLCPCPGPSMTDEYEYRQDRIGVLMARPIAF